VSDPAPLLARTGASPGKREIVLMSIARAGDLGQRIACSAPLESPGPLIPESLGKRKTLLAERRADTDEVRAAQRNRLTELQTRRGEAVRKMLAADRAIINARWSRPAH